MPLELHAFTELSMTEIGLSEWYLWGLSDTEEHRKFLLLGVLIKSSSVTYSPKM